MVSYLPCQTPYTIFAVFWHQRAQQLPHSFVKYPPSVLFFSLKERLYLIQLNISAQGGGTKNCCRKGISPLVFQQLCGIAHAIGSEDFLLIPCSQRRDRGDPNLTSKWPVSSGAQTKILNLASGHPQPKSAPHLCLTSAETLQFYHSCLLLSQTESTVVSYPCYVQVSFCCGARRRERMAVAAIETELLPQHKQEEDGSNCCQRGQ